MAEKNPHDIEKKSMEIIDKKIDKLDYAADQIKIIKRVVHATAEPELAEKVKFSAGAINTAKQLLREGADIITDVNMLKAGISKNRFQEFGGQIKCFIADEEIREKAEAEGLTRSIMSMRQAVKLDHKTIFAIGNAPTALLELIRLYKEEKEEIDFIVGTPVGFVGAAASKEKLIKTDIPHISLQGRRGGSAVAVSIVNAILYMLTDREKQS